jgi:hypothetical protein
MKGDARGIAATVGNVCCWGGLALIGGAVASGLIEPLLTLTRYIPRDANEGWNAFLAQLAMRGGELYPAPGGTIFNNYPPLSFYVVGGLGRVVGDNIFSGRAVALLSMFIVAGNIFLWLRVTGSRICVACLGSGVFAALAVTYGRSYAGMNDPQYLAHAIMTTGLVLLWRGNAQRRVIVLGSLFVLAGGLTKHLLIPLPIAITWWLKKRSRSALMTWIVCSALLLGAAAILAAWLYGSAIFESLFSARGYSLSQALFKIRGALKYFAPMIGLSLFAVPLARTSERAHFAVTYMLSAALVAALASGGIGVGINAFFDFAIAVSLCTAVAADAGWSRQLPKPLRSIEFGPTATLLLGIYLAAVAASLLPRTLRDLRALDALEMDTLHDVRAIASMPGRRAACEALELCYWAGGGFTLDFFNYGQRLKVGRQPLAPCTSVFNAQYITILQVNAKSGWGSVLLPQFCNELIQANYEPISVLTNGALLAPKNAPKP